MPTRADHYKQRGGYWTTAIKPRRCEAINNGQACMRVIQSAERCFATKACCPKCPKVFCAACAELPHN